MSENAVDADTPPDVTPHWAQPLGYAGLIPFLAGAVLLTGAAFAQLTSPLLQTIMAAQVIYGAVILSFLGGVRWGVAVAKGDVDGRVFAISVVPSLIGWVAALLPGAWALIVLAVAILIQGGWDLHTAQSGGLPSWYAHLRRHLTVVVAACLLISAGSVIVLQAA